MGIVSRLFGVLVVLSLLVPSAGFSTTLVACADLTVDCEDPCCCAPGDQGTDPAPCADCACCAHPRTPLLTSFLAAPAPRGEAHAFWAPTPAGLASDPQEILHIPKPRSALPS